MELTTFKRVQLKAEVLEEVYKEVEEKRNYTKLWDMDDSMNTIAEFEERKSDNPELEESWDIQNARRRVEEGEYKMEVYDAIQEMLIAMAKK